MCDVIAINANPGPIAQRLDNTSVTDRRQSCHRRLQHSCSASAT